ncbi:MAG: hypothetical protein IPK19_13865 [Chloroflexi bacterium]|nr:hypothetical protein [Chloroflexota bacterium]
MNSTVVQNTGQGLVVIDATLTLRNNILANNTEGDCSQATSTINAEYNLIGSGLGCVNGTNLGNKTGDPLFGTWTGNYLPLLPGSPAIDAASNTYCAAAPVNNLDQNNDTRPKDGDGDGTAVCDMGAIEAPAFVPPPLWITVDPTSAIEGGGATFTIHRGTGGTDSNLTVYFNTGGTATGGGNDYTLNPTISAVVPVGQDHGDVTLSVVNDTAAEPDETVSLTLTANSHYVFDGPTTATATIPRNDFGVINANASGQGSLKQAIENANTLAGTDTITFDAAYFATARTIDAGEMLTLSTNATIAGPGTSKLTISGGGTHQVFLVDAGVTAEIRDVTIAGGGDGGGASVAAGAIQHMGTSLTLTRCTISGNTGFFAGGVYNNTGSTLIVNNSRFANNIGSFSGSIASDGPLTISSTLFEVNSAALVGAVCSNHTLTLINSLLVANYSTGTSGTSGALRIGSPSSSATIVNSTIAWNTSAEAGRGGLWIEAGAVHLRNSILTDNGTGNCLRTGGTVNAQNSLIQTGLTCVNGTNLFNRTGAAGLNADLTLSSTSVAVDSGSSALVPPGVTTDLAGSPRIRGSRVDMGAYESTYTFLIGDINRDGSVNISDFSILAAAFGSATGSATYNPAADLNMDLAVNISDFSLLAANFGKTS